MKHCSFIAAMLLVVIASSAGAIEPANPKARVSDTSPARPSHVFLPGLRRWAIRSV